MSSMPLYYIYQSCCTYPVPVPTIYSLLLAIIRLILSNRAIPFCQYIDGCSHLLNRCSFPSWDLTEFLKESSPNNLSSIILCQSPNTLYTQWKVNMAAVVMVMEGTALELLLLWTSRTDKLFYIEQRLCMWSKMDLQHRLSSAAVVSSST